MPFTVEQFFDVFGRYNAAVWPAQIVAYALGLVAVVMALRGGRSRSVAAVLALFWLWTGVAYHWFAFAEINPAAVVFGALFVAEAMLLTWFGVRKPQLQFGYRPGLNGAVGLFFIVYAAILYPLLGLAAGHSYPQAPMFGITPCPVTIFTCGLLLIARSVPWPVLLVPVLWSLIGGSAAFLLQVPQDVLLLFSGPTTAALLWRMRRGR